MTIKNNKAGFSLVELMVVVAIIGILATIAIPNFQKFQNRAKQSQAKSELTGLYTAQRAFFAEHTSYHNNLQMVGFVPEGFIIPAANPCPNGQLAPGITRLYATGFIAGGIADNGAVSGLTPPCVAAAGGFQIRSYNSGRNNTNANAAPTNLDPPPAALAGGVAATANTFAAESRARLIGTGAAAAAADDTWTINQDKSLLNTQSGI